MTIDWNDAFDNAGRVPGAERLPERWAQAARAFRSRMLGQGLAELDIAYGPGPRNRLDLFRCAGVPTGTVVFVHGGYWMRLDKSFWSHLAGGVIAGGWNVAMPSYTLAPDARISGIAREIAQAVSVAAARGGPGPVHLVGHSAGAQLVTRMLCEVSPLPGNVANRLGRIVPVSGIYDLRPLLHTEMNRSLGLTAAEAGRESPALNRRAVDVPVTFWVGTEERPEFLRQTRLACEAWANGNVAARYVAGRNHFSVIDDLARPKSELVAELTALGLKPDEA